MRVARCAPTVEACIFPDLRSSEMPRYMVQRTFPDGLHIPVGDGGADICLAVIERNAEEGVTWIHSYVSEDKRTTFCVYDAPNPEASPKDRGPERAPARPDHAGPRTRPLPLRVRSTPCRPQHPTRFSQRREAGSAGDSPWPRCRCRHLHRRVAGPGEEKPPLHLGDPDRSALDRRRLSGARRDRRGRGHVEDEPVRQRRRGRPREDHRQSRPLSRSPSVARRSASPPSARSRTPLPAQPLCSRTEAKKS